MLFLNFAMIAIVLGFSGLIMSFDQSMLVSVEENSWRLLIIIIVCFIIFRLIEL